MSGRRDDSLLLDDLVRATSRLLELGPQLPANGTEPQSALADQVMWNLVVLGEATKRLRPQTRERFVDVPWSAMAETRDRLVHYYEGVDWSTVAEIISGELAALLARLTEIRDLLRDEFDRGL